MVVDLADVLEDVADAADVADVFFVVGARVNPIETYGRLDVVEVDDEVEVDVLMTLS